MSNEDRMLNSIKQYRNCGIVFIGLTLCIIAMIIQIVRADKVFDYDMYVIYTITAFTIYQIVVAIINFIKSHKNDNYTIRSLRSINLATALASLISFQAIALDTFSHNTNIPAANAITGFVVCGLVLVSGIYNSTFINKNKFIEKEIILQKEKGVIRFKYIAEFNCA